MLHTFAWRTGIGIGTQSYAGRHCCRCTPIFLKCKIYLRVGVTFTSLHDLIGKPIRVFVDPLYAGNTFSANNTAPGGIHPSPALPKKFVPLWQRAFEKGFPLHFNDGKLP